MDYMFKGGLARMVYDKRFGDDDGKKKYNMNQYKKDITAGKFENVAPQLPATLMPDSRLKQSRTNSLNAMSHNKSGLMI